MHAVLVPADVVKTRMQLHPEQYPSASATLKRIVGTEGARTLLAGLGPTSVGYMLHGGVKFGAFQWFKDALRPVAGERFVREHPTLFYLGCSGPAEVLASVALCPLEAVRIRMVASAGFASSISIGLQRLHREEGVRGLYKGLGPILLKQLPYTMVQLTTFSLLLDAVYGRFLEKDSLSKTQQLGVSMVGGALAGAIASVASQPGDTILTRINKEKKQSQAQGASVPTAPVSIRATIASLGFKGLWLGTVPRMAMTAVLGAGTFLVLDSLKIAVGLSTSG